MTPDVWPQFLCLVGCGWLPGLMVAGILLLIDAIQRRRHKKD
jgi:hypothetical protein